MPEHKNPIETFISAVENDPNLLDKLNTVMTRTGGQDNSAGGPVDISANAAAFSGGVQTHGDPTAVLGTIKKSIGVDTTWKNQLTMFIKDRPDVINHINATYK